MADREYGLYDTADGGLLAFSASSGWIDSDRDCLISEREAESRQPVRRRVDRESDDSGSRS